MLQHLGPADEHLVTFAPHLLDEHGNLHSAATGDVENFAVIRLRNLQRNIGAPFALEAFPNAAGGNFLAVQSRERTVIHREGHLDGRRVDGPERQRRTLETVHQRFADENIRQARHAHDVAHVGFLDLDLLEPLKMKQRRHLARHRLRIAAQAKERIAHANGPRANFAKPNPAEIIRVAHIGDCNPIALALVTARRGDALENHIKQRGHIAAEFCVVSRRVAILRAGVNVRKVQLLIRGAQGDEQLEHLIQNPIRPRMIAVNFIDHHNRLRARFQRLAQHKASLRLRPLLRIHEQQHAINHTERPLHLAAKIRVPRRVHDIHVMPAILKRRIFRLNRDALFALEVHRIHDPLLLRNRLIRPKCPRLLEKTVHQRGLPMIHVRNNCNVTDKLHDIPSRRAGDYARLESATQEKAASILGSRV